MQGIFANTIREVKVTEKRNGEQGLINATIAGKHFGISANKINSILSELGWIRKDIGKGWQITEFGKRLGGIQSKYRTTGVPYVHWPENIVKNNILITSIGESRGDISTVSQGQLQNTEEDSVKFSEVAITRGTPTA